MTRARLFRRPMPPANIRRIYFNSACPVCRAGVAAQRQRMDAAGVGSGIEWCDVVVTPDVLAGRGVSIDDVRRKLHAEDESGTLYVGADAFTSLWKATPGQRWLGRLWSLPGLSALGRWLYDRFADLLYAWNRRNGRW